MPRSTACKPHSPARPSRLADGLGWAFGGGGGEGGRGMGRRAVRQGRVGGRSWVAGVVGGADLAAALPLSARLVLCASVPALLVFRAAAAAAGRRLSWWFGVVRGGWLGSHFVHERLSGIVEEHQVCGLAFWGGWRWPAGASACAMERAKRLRRGCLGRRACSGVCL